MTRSELQALLIGAGSVALLMPLVSCGSSGTSPASNTPPRAILVRAFATSARMRTLRVVWTTAGSSSFSRSTARRVFRGPPQFRAVGTYRLGRSNWLTGQGAEAPRANVRIRSTGFQRAHYPVNGAVLGVGSKLSYRGHGNALGPVRARWQCGVASTILLDTTFGPGAYGRLLTSNEFLGVNTAPPVLPESATPLRGFLSSKPGTKVVLVRGQRSRVPHMWHIRLTRTVRSAPEVDKTEVDYWIGQRSQTLRRAVVRETASLYIAKRHRHKYFDSLLTASLYDYGNPVQIYLPATCRR